MAEIQMLGMGVRAFAMLLVISIVVSAALHYWLKYYVSPGPWSFCSKVIVGWIGGWLGSPVFGHWFEGFAYQGVFIIPAVLGAAALIVIAVDLVKMLAPAART